jgi:hypothetical protein
MLRETDCRADPDDPLLSGDRRLSVRPGGALIFAHSAVTQAKRGGRRIAHLRKMHRA